MYDAIVAYVSLIRNRAESGTKVVAGFEIRGLIYDVCDFYGEIVRSLMIVHALEAVSFAANLKLW